MSLTFDDCDAFLASFNDQKHQNGKPIQQPMMMQQPPDMFYIYNNVNVNAEPNELLFSSFNPNASDLNDFSTLNFGQPLQLQQQQQQQQQQMSSNIQQPMSLSNTMMSNDQSFSDHLSPDSFTSSNETQSSSPDVIHDHQDHISNNNRADELEVISKLLSNDDSKFNPENIKLESQTIPKSIQPKRASNIKIKPLSSSKPIASTVNVNSKTKVNSKVTKPKKEKSSHNMIEKKYRTNINDKIKLLRDCVPSLKVLTVDSGDESVELDGLQPAKKLNKATILLKATEYIKHLEMKNYQLMEENKTLNCALSNSDSRKSSTISISNDDIMSHHHHSSSLSSPATSTSSSSHDAGYYTNNYQQQPKSLGSKILMGSLACVVGSGALEDFRAGGEGNSRSLMSVPMLMYNSGSQTNGLDFPGKLFSLLGKFALVLWCACYILNINLINVGNGFEGVLTHSSDKQGARNNGVRSYLQMFKRFFASIVAPSTHVIANDLYGQINKHLMHHYDNINENVNNGDGNIEGHTNHQSVERLRLLAESMMYFPNRNLTPLQNSKMQFNKSLLVKILTNDCNFVVMRIGDWLANNFYNSAKDLIDEHKDDNDKFVNLLKSCDYEEIFQPSLISRIVKARPSQDLAISELIGSWKVQNYLSEILYIMVDSLFDLPTIASECQELISNATNICADQAIESLTLQMMTALFNPTEASIRKSLEMLELFGGYDDDNEVVMKSEELINVNYSLFVSCIMVQHILQKKNLSTGSKLEQISQVVSKLGEIDPESVNIDNANNKTNNGNHNPAAAAISALNLDHLGITFLMMLTFQIHNFVNSSKGSTYEIPFVKSSILYHLEKFIGAGRIWLGSPDGSKIDFGTRTSMIHHFVELNMKINELEIDEEASLEQEPFNDSDDDDVGSEITMDSEVTMVGAENYYIGHNYL
ncbi:hypothetical protein DASC09_021580 [Saccharomycopsis crataegensis]|uniref:BHLH domain-containing protein n=1 Tax=Saccharomycopsis crataegensis TaxID=43959 RepID=A0AAV5QJ18_9ASCO|nr:hypothetical protein DASC09_021580 [Saccharomycopsis crataegensis]